MAIKIIGTFIDNIALHLLYIKTEYWSELQNLIQITAYRTYFKQEEAASPTTQCSRGATENYYESINLYGTWQICTEK